MLTLDPLNYPHEFEPTVFDLKILNFEFRAIKLRTWTRVVANNKYICTYIANSLDNQLLLAPLLSFSLGKSNKACFKISSRRFESSLTRSRVPIWLVYILSSQMEDMDWLVFLSE